MPWQVGKGSGEAATGRERREGTTSSSTAVLRPWERAAELATPWVVVRDELRGQIHTPDSEKDSAAPTSVEAAELGRRRAAIEHTMVTRITPDLDAMRVSISTAAGTSNTGSQVAAKVQLFSGGPASEEAAAGTVMSADGAVVGASHHVQPLIRVARFSHLDAEIHTGSAVAGEVWVADVLDPDVSRRFFALSTSATEIDYFVSHSWDDDGNSKGMAEQGATAENHGAQREFGWRKSVVSAPFRLRSSALSRPSRGHLFVIRMCERPHLVWMHGHAQCGRASLGVRALTVIGAARSGVWQRGQNHQRNDGGRPRHPYILERQGVRAAV